MIILLLHQTLSSQVNLTGTTSTPSRRRPHPTPPPPVRASPRPSPPESPRRRVARALGRACAGSARRRGLCVRWACLPAARGGASGARAGAPRVRRRGPARGRRAVDVRELGLVAGDLGLQPARRLLPAGSISHADKLEDGRAPAPRLPADPISRAVLRRRRTSPPARRGQG